MSKYGQSSDRSAGGSSEGLGVSTLISLILRRKLLFALLILCATVGVSIIHFWLPVYEARTSLVFQTANSSQLQAVSARLATLGIQEDETREMDRYVSRLSSPGFMLRVAHELRTMDLDLAMFHREMRSTKRRLLWGLGKMLHLPMAESSIKDIDDEEMAEVLNGSVFFSPNGFDHINISVRNGDARSASVVTNVVADMAVKVLLSEGVKDLEDARNYVEIQAKEIEKVIRDIEDNLAKLRLSRGMSAAADSDGVGADQTTEIQRQLTEANLAYEENLQRIAKLNKELEAQRQRDPSLGNASVDPQNRYGIPRKIAELKRLNEQVALKQAALRQFVDKMLHSQSLGDGERLFELRKRMEFEYTIYEELKKQAFQLEMRRIGANNKVQVTDHVRENGARRSDNLPMKLMIALILAFFSGLPMAVLWELARPGVRTGRDLTDAGLAYLGGIPLVSGRFSIDKRLHGPKICRFDSDSEIAMAIVQIRSRLLYLSDRKEAHSQVIGVVSAKPAEGKSFFARNLAASFGHMGRRTLLIDCDLRKAMTSDYFSMTDAAGLGEILTGTRKFGEVVQRQVVKGVDLIPAGRIRSNITDLFADASLSELVRDLREVYDHIVMDTPSMIAVPDAPMILRAADLPLLLAAMNETKQPDLEVSLDRIRALYSGDIYAVLNRVTGGQVPLYVINTGSKRGGASNLFGGTQGGTGA